MSGVNIPVGAKDNASGPLEKIRDRFERLGTSGGVKSFTQGLGMGAGIGVFNAAVGAIKGVGDALGGMVESALDDEASVARLQRTLDNNTPGWRANAAAIDTAIVAGQKLGFTDDQLRESMGALVARTKDVQKGVDLQRLAMDLARAKGIDLATASNLVGKVYSGNVGILQRYGIAVEKGASSTQALAAIQKMAGGQADTYSKTTKGSMEALGVAFGEVGESLGKALLPLLNALVPILRDKVMPIVIVLATAFGQLIEAISPLVGFVLDALIEGFKVVANVVITAGQALLTVAAAIPGPWQQGAKDMDASLQKIKDSLNDTSKVASSIASDIGPQVGGELAEGADDVGEGAEDAFGGIEGEAQAAGRKAVAATEASLGQIVGAIRGSRDEFTSAWKGALDAGAREQQIAGELQQVAADMTNKELLKKLKSRNADERAEAATRLAELRRHQSALLAEQSTYGDTATQMARTKALLASQAMVDGLRSSDPQVAEYWRSVQKGANDRLGELTRQLEGEGRAAAAQWAAGVKSKESLGKVNTAVGAVAGRTHGALESEVEGRAWAWGATATYNYAAGLKAAAALRAVTASVMAVINAISPYLKGHSPPREGPLSDIDQWGVNVGRAWATGLTAGASRFRLALPAGLAASAAGMGSGAGGASGGLVGVGGGGPLVAITIERYYGDRDGVIELSREIGQQVRLATIKGAT